VVSPVEANARRSAELGEVPLPVEGVGPEGGVVAGLGVVVLDDRSERDVEVVVRAVDERGLELEAILLELVGVLLALERGRVSSADEARDLDPGAEGGQPYAWRRVLEADWPRYVPRNPDSLVE
jgi:hypothetical protein